MTCTTIHSMNGHKKGCFKIKWVYFDLFVTYLLWIQTKQTHTMEKAEVFLYQSAP